MSIPIFDLPTVTLTLREYSAPAVNAYGEVTATPTDSTIEAVVHPNAGRRQLERLADADRARELISIYTLTALSTVGAARPDQVRYRGRWYEIIDSADYTDHGAVYLHTAALIEETS